MSRRTTILACILLLCVSMLSSALAQPEPYCEPRCNPAEVDLSEVREENGRLTGVMRLPESAGVQGEVRVDCPVPEAFPAEAAQMLHVSYKSMGVSSLKNAMEAIGQNAETGELNEWSGENQFAVSYSVWEPNRAPWSGARNRLLEASRFDDPAHADTYNQAKDMARSMLAQLGATVYEPLLHAARYDAEHVVDADGFACYSNGEALYRNALDNFERNAKKYAHAERGLTMVYGLYELNGLPVMANYQWKDGAYYMGAGSEIRAIVSDDGELCMFELSGLPTVEVAEPLTLPDYTWQEMLANVASGWWLGNPHAEDDANVSDFGGEPYTVYATYSVITELRPCWIGFEHGRLAPGYYANVEERTVNGDKTVSVWSSYGDAETMTLVH